MNMIPGMSQMKNIDIDNDSFKYIEAMIHSMTPIERSNPKKIIDHSRKSELQKGLEGIYQS